MLEQFCAEAESAREAFQLQSFMSATDAPFMPQKSLSREAVSLRDMPKKGVEQSQLQLPVSTKQRQSYSSSTSSRRSADRRLPKREREREREAKPRTRRRASAWNILRVF